MSSYKRGNIFCNINNNQEKEVFNTIIRSSPVTIKRIISCGQSTPGEKWLKEKKNEWVILLKGSAALKFMNKKSLVILKKGEHVFILAGLKHRVEYTGRKQETVWLAVYF